MIVDTSVWINYLAGIEDPQTNWLVHQLSEPEIGLTDLILCEVLQGVRGDAAFLRTQHRLSDFSIFSTAGEGLAIASAKNYRFLRTRGQTVRNTIDCLIATCCIRDGYSLLHHDRDFDAFEKYLGLEVIHPLDA